LITRAYLGTLDHGSLREEIRRQLQRFESALGRPPDFVDGHQHVHQLPIVRDALLSVLDERRDRPRPWLRSTLVPPQALPRGTRGKAATIARLGGRALNRLAATHGYPQNGRLLGVYGFGGDESLYLAHLQAWLDVAGNDDVLMCHPSTPGAWRDPILPARMREYRVLAGREFGGLLSQRGIAVRPLAPVAATGRAA
jgi:predicted glycoside hydrolase/deacetylase ChbG (UPF0249 family)